MCSVADFYQRPPTQRSLSSASAAAVKQVMSTPTISSLNAPLVASLHCVMHCCSESMPHCSTGIFLAAIRNVVLNEDHLQTRLYVSRSCNDSFILDK
jgi:hypothetical protein